MRTWWRRRRLCCDRWRAEWIYVDGGTKGRLYCWECNTWLTDVLPLLTPTLRGRRVP